MGRPHRIQFEGALYHVFFRGNRRERIAHADQDYRLLEQYLIEAARKSGAKPQAWRSMPNHMHVMVGTPLGNLSTFMQMWLGRYARYYNQAYKKVGHVFQGRYGSRLVDKDTYQKELLRYIDLQRYRSKNPEKIDPSCDRYSSRRFYMGETCPPDVASWIDPMLQLFGETKEQARRAYAHYLADGLQSGRWEDFYKTKNGIVGSDAFVKTVEKEMQEKASVLQLPKWHEEEAINHLLNTALDLFHVNREDLISPSQRRSLCRARQAIAYMGRHVGISSAALARALGRSRPAVHAMAAIAGKRPSDKLKEWQLRPQL